MRITLLYNNYGDNGLGEKHKTFKLQDERDILEMILWLSACGMYPNHTPERIIKEVVVNGKHFKTSKYLNPSDWANEINEAL